MCEPTKYWSRASMHVGIWHSPNWFSLPQYLFLAPRTQYDGRGSQGRTHRLVGLGNRYDDGQHTDELEDGPQEQSVP